MRLLREDVDILVGLRNRALESPEWAQAYGTWRIATAIEQCARKLEKLGMGDAATPMGAIEMLAMEVKGVASVISDFTVFSQNKD